MRRVADNPTVEIAGQMRQRMVTSRERHGIVSAAAAASIVLEIVGSIVREAASRQFEQPAHLDISSTRRLRALPSSLSFDATGDVAPAPDAVRRSGPIA